MDVGQMGDRLFLVRTFEVKEDKQELEVHTKTDKDSWMPQHLAPTGKGL